MLLFNVENDWDVPATCNVALQFPLTGTLLVREPLIFTKEEFLAYHDWTVVEEISIQELKAQFLEEAAEVLKVEGYLKLDNAILVARASLTLEEVAMVVKSVKPVYFVSPNSINGLNTFISVKVAIETLSKF